MTTTDLDLMQPDALHRETQRRLQWGGDPSAAPLVLERGYWPAGPSHPARRRQRERRSATPWGG
ncbi:hypothetical protein [Vreelandella sp.]|uniref:hypothetical protein n=1 Tax=Vreelandella sp. TaxID=3137778 RepID=UPI003BAD9F0D